MALNFGKGNRSIAFAPTAAFPLNANSYFESYDLALAAALTAKPAGDTTTKYYFGQEIAVAEMVNNVPQSAKLYIIAPTVDAEGNVVGTLNEVGSATDGDGASIELVDGVLSIKDFGKRYYQYIAAVEGGEPGHYELVEVDDDQHKWHTGLEPRIDANGNIAWYEQNTDTVDGMQGQISGVQEDVENLDKVLNAEGGLVDQVEDLQEEIGHAATEAGDSATGLYAELEKKADADSVYTTDEVDDLLKDKANADNVYTKDSVYTKGETDSAIATAVNAADHLKRKIFETLALAETFIAENADVAEQYIYMIPTEDTEGSNRYHEYMVLDGNLEQVGNWEVDLSNYVTKESLATTLDDYYTVEEINTTLDGYYTAEEIDTTLADYAKSTDLNNYYTKTETNTAIEDGLKDVKNTLESQGKEIETLKTNVGSLQELTAQQTKDIAANTALIEGLTAVDGTITLLEKDLDELAEGLQAVEGLIGTPRSEDAEGMVTPATGLIREVDDIKETIKGITSAGGERNRIHAIFAGDNELVPNNDTDRIVTIPVFTGLSDGLVPVVNNLPDGANASDYVLNGKGQWILAADSRIGNLTYKELQYNTVEDYVAAYVDDKELLWEEI